VKLYFKPKSSNRENNYLIVIDNILEEKLGACQGIAILGASGWIGRECVYLLNSLIGKDFHKKVVLISSSSKNFRVGQNSFQTVSINDQLKIENIDLLIDFAFLTQDKMLNLGQKAYVELNQNLNKDKETLINRFKPKYIYYASSGAADRSVLLRTSSDSKRIYGELKIEAEESLLDISKVIGSKLLLNRIWSLSGKFMLEPNKYAIGNFITQAMNSRKICINSSDQVFRSYIDANDLLKLCLGHLLEGNSGLLNSGGHRTSFLDLAKMIYLEFKIREELNPNLIVKNLEEDYYSPNDDLNIISNRYNFELQDIRKQIRNTVLAINS
jgi:nucleoside-diphosphate-sugar epimerase